MVPIKFCSQSLLLFTVANFIIATIVFIIFSLLFYAALLWGCMGGCWGALADMVAIIIIASISGIAAIPLLFYYFPRLILGMTATYLKFFDTNNIKFLPSSDKGMIISYVESKIITYLWIMLFTLFFCAITGVTSLTTITSLFSSSFGILKFIIYILCVIILRYFFMFSTYFIVDKNFNAYTATKTSWKMSWNHLGTIIALSIITCLVFLIPIIGLPITQAMSVYLYRILTKTLEKNIT